MMQQRKIQQNNFYDKLLEWGLKNKFIVSIFVAALLLIGLAAGILNVNAKKNQDSANQMYDEAVYYINNVSYLTTNDNERARIFSEQINKMNEIVQKYPQTVASIRANLYLGRFYYDDAYRQNKPDGFSLALSHFNSALESSKTSFYKVLSLLGRAQCYDQLNELENAFADYRQILLKYPKEGFVPVALVGMARTREVAVNPDYNVVLEYYNRVISEYPDSIWAKYAKSKIYFYSDPANRVQPAGSSNAMQLNLLPQ